MEAMLEMALENELGGDIAADLDEEKGYEFD